MLWRVRTTLPDRPGALAVLAQDCGAAGVNILGLQIFPGVDTVTDELILRTPSGWSLEEITALVRGSGGTPATGTQCSESALVDQPTRHVQAARAVLAKPASFPEVLARLLDAEAHPETGDAELDTLEVRVGGVAVQVHRRAAFTATEQARAQAMADLVSDVLGALADDAPAVPQPLSGVGQPRYSAQGDRVLAVVADATIGSARLQPDQAGESAVARLSLRVDPSWQRRGIGSRLLTDAARLAAGQGYDEITMTTAAGNNAVLPMVLGTGLRGRIRMAGDELTVRVPVRELRSH